MSKYGSGKSSNMFNKPVQVSVSMLRSVHVQSERIYMSLSDAEYICTITITLFPNIVTYQLFCLNSKVDKDAIINQCTVMYKICISIRNMLQ